jgi:hypothetical protein
MFRDRRKYEDRVISNNKDMRYGKITLAQVSMKEAACTKAGDLPALLVNIRNANQPGTLRIDTAG